MFFPESSHCAEQMVLKQVRYQGESSQQIRQKSPMALLGDFYQKIAKEPLSLATGKMGKTALKAAHTKRGLKHETIKAYHD